MPYQITHILQKATKDDARYIIDTLKSKLSFTDNISLEEGFKHWKDGAMPLSLARGIEKDLRYLASNDIAYKWRQVYKKENPPGIRIEEVVNDAAKELGIKTKPFCSIEQRLQTIVESFVENNFTKLPVDSQIELLKKVNLPCDQITTIIDGVKNKKLSVIPVLISAAGPTLTAIFVDALLTKLITKMISKKASDSIIKEVSSKLPLKLLGPVMWWASTLWIANSLFLGPVKRKTVRVVLHLGLISLRNSDTQN